MFSFKYLSLFVSASFCLLATRSYAEMIFPAELLNIKSDDVADISGFSANGSQLPGQYPVDIYVNDSFVENKMISFQSLPVNAMSKSDVKDETGLYPCLSPGDLSNAGVKTELFPDLNTAENGGCLELTQHIPAAFYHFNFSKLRLDISIPQMYVRNTSRGYIDPVFWDNGITAALLNYNFSGNNRIASTADSKSYFLNLNSGINVGPWRLRDYRTWNYNQNQYGHFQQWQRINSYLERAVIPIRSSLLIGEGTTSGDIFDALRFRGVQLATDDNMYPDTMRGFAPVVRGIAESNAEVTIVQGGYTIYKTSVSPGPFEITDLNSMITSGDLNVTVKEANGRIHSFIVPYTSVPVLLREGRLKYGITMARYRSTDSRYESPAFLQGTLAWGGPFDITLYGGFQYSSNYQAIQSGAGINMGHLGALSADMTHADSTLVNGKDYTGQSVRFLYSRSFNDTGTRFRLTGYRYSTKGFHTLDETALNRISGRLYNPENPDKYGYPSTDPNYSFYDLNNSKRARFEANISQAVGTFGSVWLSGVRQTYWRDGASNDSLHGPASYSLNYGYTRQKSAGAASYTDRTIGLSVSVPLAKIFGSSSERSTTYATFYGNRDGQGNTRSMAGVSGSLLEDGNLNWNASQSVGSSYGNSGDASMDYRGRYGNTGIGYSYDRDNQQISYNASGGMILHREGLTFGQPLSETAVLISTDGVSDVSIQNEPGVRTDWRGFTVKPYTSAYRENRVAIDIQALDDRTDLSDGGVAKVVPTKGAIVRAGFNVRRGQRMLLTLKRNGKPLPFGSVVTAENTNGLVGDDGLVYLSGMPEKGKIHASWGKGNGQSCVATYHQTVMASSIIRISAECQ